MISPPRSEIGKALTQRRGATNRSWLTWLRQMLLRALKSGPDYPRTMQLPSPRLRWGVLKYIQNLEANLAPRTKETVRVWSLRVSHVLLISQNTGSLMPHYPMYTTTVIGAYSIPRWYESLDRLITLGQLQPADMADAQFRTMQAAVLEQEIAGIDIITGGEAHRRTHNRHSPPNAMLNHFWQKIPALQGVTRPKPITKYDPNVTHPAATCTGSISDSTELGLVDEISMVTALTKKTDKITMTGQ